MVKMLARLCFENWFSRHVYSAWLTAPVRRCLQHMLLPWWRTWGTWLGLLSLLCKSYAVMNKSGGLTVWTYWWTQTRHPRLEGKKEEVQHSNLYDHLQCGKLIGWHFIILTNADDDESCHSIENAEIFHSKHHMIQEERHKTAQTNTGQAKERQKHCGEMKLTWSYSLFKAVQPQ